MSDLVPAAFYMVTAGRGSRRRSPSALSVGGRGHVTHPIAPSVFLPVTRQFGYASMWAAWLCCTCAYFLFGVFALPETRGRTLEDIERLWVTTATR